jgi:hypothetical protein
MLYPTHVASPDVYIEILRNDLICIKKIQIIIDNGKKYESSQVG